MPDSNEILIILVTLVIVGVGYYFLFGKSSQKNDQKDSTLSSNPLQLQAYERMILLVDRIAIPNLISRTPMDGLSARDLQMVLTRNIREEFDYNITQQIYISPETWKAVKSLKENNLLIINQACSNLPVTATAIELSRSVLDFLLTDQKGNMHELVSEALSYEAKKLL
jgi:hypothetical protein